MQTLQEQIKELEKEYDVVEYFEIKGIELKLHTRDWRRKLELFYIVPKGLEYMDGGILGSGGGDGNTIDEALEDLAEYWSNRKCVIDAYKSTRHEFKIPKLVHKNKIGK